MTTMTGPHTDTQPPTGTSWEESTTEWSFTNGLSRERTIDDLRIVVDGPWYSILPDIRKVVVKAADGSALASETYSDVHEVHIKINPPVKAGEEFDVEVHFDSTFDQGESIQFIPTNDKGNNVVASINPIDPEFLAISTALVPPVIGDVATVGGVIPVPWWWGGWVYKIVRWLLRMMPSLLANGGASYEGVSQINNPHELAERVLKNLKWYQLTDSRVKREILKALAEHDC